MLLRTVLTVMIAAPLLAGAREPSNAPLVLDVWPGKTPQDSGVGEYGPIAPERIRDPADAPTKTATWITGVTHPTLTVYRPSKGKNTGAAFIVCPEAGTGTWPGIWREPRSPNGSAPRGSPGSSSSIGYRAVQENPSPSPLRSSPGCPARRQPRAQQGEGVGYRSEPHWHRRLLGGRASCSCRRDQFRPAHVRPLDAIDKVSCRPDFAVAAYPGYLVDIKTWELRPSIRIPAGTPRSSWYTRSAIRSLAQARPIAP